MNSIRPPARRFLVLLALVGGLLATVSCEKHGQPFVPVRPGGPDSTLVDGLEEGRWVAKKSPYYAISPITVLAGRTLVIEPGVTVIFTRSEYGMTIRGQLLAVGKRDSLITFRQTLRQGVTPLPGEWVGLSFEGAGSRGSRVEFANLRYAQTAIRAIDSDLTLRSLGLSSAEFDAVRAVRSHLNVVDCTVANNGRHGILLEECEDPLYRVRLDHLNIGFNLGAGIWAVSSSLTATRCDIKNNGQEGGAVINAQSAGVHFEGLAGAAPPNLKRCNIEFNQPCDLRNIMLAQISVQADSNYWGAVSRDEMDFFSDGRKDRCNFNVRLICDGLDSLTSEIPTVHFCHWSDAFFPNFSSSGQSPDWGFPVPLHDADPALRPRRIR